MVSFFTQKIVCRLTKNRNVSEEDLEVYNYVLEYLIENILLITLMVIIGIVSGKIKEMCVFFIVFLLLRKTAGGIHANTPESCMFFSIMIYLINIYGAKAIDKIIQPLNIGIEIIAAIAIAAVAPVDSKNLRLDNIRKRKYKWITLCVISMITMVSTIVSLATDISITSSVIVCYITVLILQLIGIVKNNKEGVYEYEDKREEKISGKNE